MKKHIMKLNIILFSLLFPFLLYAQDGQGGTESNFHFGFGARAMGMGQAYTALADDPTAVFWNPAGLEFIYQQNLTLFHMTAIEGTLYDFLGYSFPTLRLGTFAVGIARMSTGDIVERDTEKNPGSTFAWEFYQAYVAYAKKLPYNITAGFSVKVLREQWGSMQWAGDLNDTGVGMDLGFMYQPEYSTNILLRDWSFGLNFKNLFAPKLNVGDEIDDYPLSIRLGLLRKIYFSGGGGDHINIVMDLDHSANRDVFIHMGSEYRFRDLGMIRLGYDAGSLSFGAGIIYNFMQVDYSYGSAEYSDYFEPAHRISISFNFGKNRDELYAIAEAERKAEEERIIAEMRESDRQKFVAEHMKVAEEYFQKGEYFNAVVEYQQIIGQDPFNQRANMMLDSANTMLQNNFAQEQSRAVQNALDKDRAERDREYVNEHFEKGRMLLDQKKYTEAIIEFNIALERDPTNETIRTGITTTNRRIIEETGSLIRQARREFDSENYSEALRLLADARLLGGEDAQIQAEIEPLAARIKLQQNIQNGLGLFEIGEYDQALIIFEEALRIDPEDHLVRQYYDKAKIETIGAQEKMDPETERKYMEGVDLYVKGRYRQAIQVWDEILKAHPYNKKVLTAIKGARDRMKKENQ
ncbi:MAG: PorV/PorQ family protein [Calditrichaceae bacterium]|nr:PorV/PorQ family protein [Calditrichaceae bacterium]MBN2709355.1 PorV/PorQ family protein [Calditrichaceae bacterium]RQV94689.1 MAG: PorV/PorQ family protein [Calditrichota bacterium]